MVTKDRHSQFEIQILEHKTKYFINLVRMDKDLVVNITLDLTEIEKDLA